MRRRSRVRVEIPEHVLALGDFELVESWCRENRVAVADVLSDWLSVPWFPEPGPG